MLTLHKYIYNMDKRNLIGLKFGRLTVIKEIEPFILPCGQKNKAFLCKCDCGNEHTVRRVHLVRGKSKSCGCIVRTMRGEGQSKLLKVWKQMNSRCTEEDNVYFKKGIRVSEDWKSDFWTFKKWADENGYKDGLVIDRKDNLKGYSSENCRWVTQLVNNMNKSNTFMVNYKGEIKPLKMIITEKKIRQHYESILRRIKRGWSVERAIDTPIRSGNYKKSRSQEDIDNENELMFSRL